MLLQVSGFVTTLRLFFVYGLNSRPQLTSPAIGHNEQGGVSLNFYSEEPKKKGRIPYRPPHLRKKYSESSTVDFILSDSDYSDNDGSLKDTDSVQGSKVRVAALVCLQVSSQNHCFML